jgi:basic amino acid/polyamine antiporter, APA family
MPTSEKGKRQAEGPRLMDSNPSAKIHSVSAFTAACIVVANMVGTGVFTSLGFQVAAFKSPFVILALWVVGGVGALCGALSYGELGAAMPRSGGEYNFLSRIYHPAIGFLSGWVSLTVGFAAPVALAAMALAVYLSRVIPVSHPRLAAAGVVCLVSLVHAFGLKAGARFQVGFTVAKVLLIAGFSLCGLFMADPESLRLLPVAGDLGLLMSGSFAVSLVFVSYAYSGWNAAAYVVGEMENPRRNLPKALLFGTAVVMALYLLLNFVFLRAAPMGELSGQVEVGYIAAAQIFGPAGGRLMGGLIALGLVSTISAMTWAGPRVAQVMGEDIPLFARLAATSPAGAPVGAILFQLAIVLTLLFTSTFEKVLTYLGFTLALCSFLTVAGVFVLRVRKPGLDRPYRTWGYPVPPAIFLAINGWMLVYILKEKPAESLAGLGTLFLGLLLYFPAARKGLAQKS